MVLGRKPALRLLLALLAQLGAAIGGRIEIPFGRGWRWHRGDAPDGPGLGSGALSGFHNVTSCTNTHKMDGWAPQGDKSAGYPPGVTSCGIACSYDDSCTAFSDGRGYCAHGFADSVCNGTGVPRAHVMQRGPGVGFQRNFSFAATDFDDSGWKRATLPHDPLINQTFDPAAGEGSGFVPRKVIWYQRFKRQRQGCGPASTGRSSGPACTAGPRSLVVPSPWDSANLNPPCQESWPKNLLRGVCPANAGGAEFLLYPPRSGDPSDPAVSSIRWELVAKGLADAEYFVALQRLRRGLARCYADGATELAGIIASSNAALDAVGSVVWGFTYPQYTDQHWSGPGAVYADNTTRMHEVLDGVAAQIGAASAALCACAP